APEHFPGGDLFLLLLEDLAQDARAGGRHLHGHLVGFDLDQRLIERYRLADLLEPAQHLAARALGLLLGRAPAEESGRHGRAHRLARCRSACTMRALVGTAASSSTGLCGLGTSGIASRSTGASSS